MKGYQVTGGNGSYVHLEDGRHADTVTGETSEEGGAEEALSQLLNELTEELPAPPGGDRQTALEYEQYVGAP